MTWCLYFSKIICNHTHIYYMHIIFGYGIYIGINSFRRGWKATNSNMFFFGWLFLGGIMFFRFGHFFWFLFPCFFAFLLFAFLLFPACLLLYFFASLLLHFSASLLLCFSTVLPLCFSAFLLFPGFLLFQLLCFLLFHAFLLFQLLCLPAYLLFCFSAFSLFFVVSHTADNPYLRNIM